MAASLLQLCQSTTLSQCIRRWMSRPFSLLLCRYHVWCFQGWWYTRLDWPPNGIHECCQSFINTILSGIGMESTDDIQWMQIRRFLWRWSPLSNGDDLPFLILSLTWCIEERTRNQNEGRSRGKKTKDHTTAWKWFQTIQFLWYIVDRCKFQM